MPEQLQGKSFTSLIDNSSNKFRKYAYSRFLDGDVVINERYAYTHYTGGKFGDGIMLYDHANDPDENENVAMKPEYKKVVEEMEAWIKSSQKRALKID